MRKYRVCTCVTCVYISVCTWEVSVWNRVSTSGVWEVCITNNPNNPNSPNDPNNSNHPKFRVTSPEFITLITF